MCNSFNNKNTKPRNKLNLDQVSQPFDLEEIRQGIKKLDYISSEVVTCSNIVLLSKTTKLLNLILDSGYYPVT